VEEHLSHNLTDALRLSADAYYNVGGETSIDGTSQRRQVGAGMGLRIWRGADIVLDFELVVAKPSGARCASGTLHDRAVVVKIGDRREHSNASIIKRRKRWNGK
jgi:hypothetical protein